MPWDIETFQGKRWYHSPWAWVGVSVALGVIVFAGTHAKDAYHGWRQTRRLERGSAAFAQGDYHKSIVYARTVLAFDPKNIAATRLLARSFEAEGAPAAVDVRRQLEMMGGGDAENSLALAAQLWKAGDKAATERALDEAPVAARSSGKFQELSARVASANGDAAAATTHWAEAARIEPGNDSYRLELAIAQIRTGDETQRAAALTELEKLATQPATRSAALRVLVEDAAARRERSRSLELSALLIGEPGATFADRLKRLGVLHAWQDDGFAPLLAELKQRAADTPEDLYLLLVWMNEHGFALAVSDLAGEIPPASLAVPQIRAALADADARASNWKVLREKLEHDSWAEIDYLRLAHLSRALDRLGDETGAAAAWANAVVGAQTHPLHLELLGRTMRDWGLDGRAVDALWKRARFDRCPRWVADYLWSEALKKHDSARLYEASQLVLRADPKNLAARNNHIALALLTGHDEGSPHALAFALHEQAPDDPKVATTYGLSLFQQRHATEAVEVMKRFSAEQLREPLTALYYGVFLAGAKRLAEARDFLEIAASAPMLDEELAMFDNAVRAAPLARAHGLNRESPIPAGLRR